MTTITLQGDTEITLYDSIFEMPTHVYAHYTAATLLGSGIGTPYEGIERSIVAVNEKDLEKALVELQNAYVGLKHIEQDFDCQQVAFMCCVKSIDGNLYEAKTNEQRYLDALALGQKGLTQGHVIDFLESIKKK